jgi:hypothetical protein
MNKNGINEIAPDNLIDMPEWTHTDKFHLPLGRIALPEVIAIVPWASSADAVTKPGQIVAGTVERQKIVIGDLSDYGGGNPDHVIGFDGTVRK